MLRTELEGQGMDVSLLDKWYKKDSNAVPPTSILQPISSILKNFNNKVNNFQLRLIILFVQCSVYQLIIIQYYCFFLVIISCLCIFKRIPKLQQEDQAIWWDTMCKMQKLFRKGAQSLFNNGKFDKDTMHNYFMSGT